MGGQHAADGQAVPTCASGISAADTDTGSLHAFFSCWMAFSSKPLPQIRYGASPRRGRNAPAAFAWSISCRASDPYVSSPAKAAGEAATRLRSSCTPRMERFAAWARCRICFAVSAHTPAGIPIAIRSRVFMTVPLPRLRRPSCGTRPRSHAVQKPRILGVGQRVPASERPAAAERHRDQDLVGQMHGYGSIWDGSISSGARSKHVSTPDSVVASAPGSSVGQWSWRGGFQGRRREQRRLDAAHEADNPGPRVSAGRDSA